MFLQDDVFQVATFAHFSSNDIVRACGVVVSHPLSMREALGSSPSMSKFLLLIEFLFDVGEEHQ